MQSFFHFSVDVYHTTFDWPTSSEVADRLETVAGNSEEEILNKLVNYHRHVEGIVTSFSSVHKIVNADQPKADVFSQGGLRSQKTFLYIRPHETVSWGLKVLSSVIYTQ